MPRFCVLPAWGFCYWYQSTFDPRKPLGRGGEAQGQSAQSSSLATNSRATAMSAPAPGTSQETAWSRGTFLQLEFGAVMGMLGWAVQECLSAWGNLHRGSCHSILQRDLAKGWHCSNPVSLYLQLGLLSTTQGNAGAGT